MIKFRTIKGHVYAVCLECGKKELVVKKTIDHTLDDLQAFHDVHKLCKKPDQSVQLKLS